MKLKTYYFNENKNFGDLLSVPIIHKLFGCEPVWSDCYRCSIFAAGSILWKLYRVTGSAKGVEAHCRYWGKKVSEVASNAFFPPLHIWGSGLFGDESKTFFRQNIIFHALRGELTKAVVEKAIGKKLNVVLGDPGILASCLLEYQPEKKYQVGIIPHFNDQNHPLIKQLFSKFIDSLFINVKEDPELVINQIARCETVLSSSLHGLIVADSLNIPNRHIVASELVGGNFKFRDYYSSYGLEHSFTDLNNNDIVSIPWIRDNYRITKEMVDVRKSELTACFPAEFIER
jgi:hypothetical protein